MATSFALPCRAMDPEGNGSSPLPAVSFEQQLQPIFVKACHGCHGPDLKAPQANFRLDELSLRRKREGKPAFIDPEQPDESELLRRVTSTDPAIRMPPTSAGDPLSDGEIATIRAWIQQQSQRNGNGAVRVTQRPPRTSPMSRHAFPAENPASQQQLSRSPASRTTRPPRGSSAQTGPGTQVSSITVAPALSGTMPAVLGVPTWVQSPLRDMARTVAEFDSPTGGSRSIARNRTTPMAAVGSAVTYLSDVAEMTYRVVVPEDRKPDNELQLTLPPMGYAVVGAPIGINLDNIVLTEDLSAYRFVVRSSVGSVAGTTWTLTADNRQIGDHPWSVDVWKGEEFIARKSMTWRVSAADRGNCESLSMLIVGDSLTHATEYPNDLAQRLSLPGQPRWKMLGTHHTEWAAPGVLHEGYGGWTWEAFVRRYVPDGQPPGSKGISPFVFARDGAPKLDLHRYFAESTQGSVPDYVVILLGANDCFSIDPDDPENAEAQYEHVLQTADALIAEFRRTAPHAELAICLIPPPNARESAFQANYGDRMPRWRWKRIQHRFLQRQIDHFGNREDDHIFIVPTELFLDPIAGYPDNNAIHPNTLGYQQIAGTIHAWLTARWHEK